MVWTLEIPEYLYYVIFALLLSFIIYAIEPPQTNYISAPISNFTNINKTLFYTVDKPDNITKAIYLYGGLTNTARALNISKDSVVRLLDASRTFYLNCTVIFPKKFGDPFLNILNCDIMGETYLYDPWYHKITKNLDYNLTSTYPYKIQ